MSFLRFRIRKIAHFFDFSIFLKFVRMTFRLIVVQLIKSLGNFFEEKLLQFCVLGCYWWKSFTNKRFPFGLKHNLSVGDWLRVYFAVIVKRTYFTTVDEWKSIRRIHLDLPVY